MHSHTGESEQKRLQRYVTERGIRNSSTRKKILDVFASVEHHVSAAELHELVKKDFPGIGLATVYRTMKILCEAGLAQEIDFGDGTVRYEHKLNHDHHDHLICVKCGRCVEVVDSGIERLQRELAERNGFRLLSHSMKLFGVCRECGPDLRVSTPGAISDHNASSP